MLTEVGVEKLKVAENRSKCHQ